MKTKQKIIDPNITRMKTLIKVKENFSSNPFLFWDLIYTFLWEQKYRNFVEYFEMKIKFKKKKYFPRKSWVFFY